MDSTHSTQVRFSPFNHQISTQALSTARGETGSRSQVARFKSPSCQLHTSARFLPSPMHWPYCKVCHRSQQGARRKFAPTVPITQKMHHRGQITPKITITIELQTKRVGLHICKALSTPTAENKGGYWLRQNIQTKPPSCVSAHTTRTKFAPGLCDHLHQFAPAGHLTLTGYPVCSCR